MSYEEFFGLQEQPFSNAPDSRFYFESEQHSEAMMRLLHAIETFKGLTVMLGDIGTGKTLLGRKILDRLDSKRFEAALLVIVHSAITPSWFLRKIAFQVGVEEPSEDKGLLLTQIYERLMQIYDDEKQAVVLIDEANMLKTREIMEEIRGLLNLEVPARKLLSIILFGLPELEESLALDEPLRQRVEMKFILKPLSLESTRAYIEHRLKVAGSNRSLFTPEAEEVVYSYSRGIPRLVNTICDNALFEVYLTKKDIVSLEIVERVAFDLGFKSLSFSPSEK